MNIKFVEYDGISGYARVMYNDVKEADKYHIEVAYNGKDVKALLEYLFELEEENKRLNNIINKGIEAINVYQNEKTLSVDYEDLKRIRGILRENEFDLKMFEEYLQELKGSDK